MSVYIDTSALIAVLDQDDTRHLQAARTWTRLVESDEEMVVSGYSVAETAAVLQSRYSTEVVRMFFERMLPRLKVYTVDSDLQTSATTVFLACLSKSSPSLVDCSAFEIVRKNRITDVFAYDKHFQNRGYNLVGE